MSRKRKRRWFFRSKKFQNGLEEDIKRSKKAGTYSEEDSGVLVNVGELGYMDAGFSRGNLKRAGDLCIIRRIK